MFQSGGGIFFRLLRRAEVADRIKNFFFLVPDQAVIFIATLLNLKPTRERHPDGMAGFIQDKHREC